MMRDQPKMEKYLKYLNFIANKLIAILDFNII